MSRTHYAALDAMLNALFAVPLLSVMPADAQNKTVVVLGTATPGGGFPAYGDAFAGAINETDTTLDVQPRNTKGSTENVPLLEAGKIDIGLTTGEVAYEAFKGIGRSPAKLAILTAMYSQPGFFAVRGDSPYSRSLICAESLSYSGRGVPVLSFSRVTCSTGWVSMWKRISSRFTSIRQRTVQRWCSTHARQRCGAAESDGQAS